MGQIGGAPSSTIDSKQTTEFVPKLPRLRGPLLLCAALLISACLWLIPQRANGEDSFLLPFVLWVAAFTVYAGALSERSANGTSWWRDGGDFRPIITVILLTTVGLVLRLWNLGTIPFNLSGDEASQGLEAVRIITGEITNPFTTGWLGVPTMGFYLTVPTIHSLGQTAFALRLPWMIVGVATIPLTYLFMRRISNVTIALVATALVATYHFHIHYSRLGSNQIGDPFFLTAALWLLYRAADRRRLLDWAWVGAASGLAFYFYAGARLTVLVVGVCCLIILLHHPRNLWRELLRGMVVLAGAFTLVFAPMLQYAIRFPDAFNARINEVGIIQNGWLLTQSAETEQSIVRILLDQLQRAALAFHYYPDRTVWYGLKAPLLDSFFGVVLIVGMVLALLAVRKRPTYVALVVWWWAAVIFGGVLTEGPPSSQRLVTMAVPTCGLIAIALVELADIVRSLAPISRQMVLAVGVVIFAGLSFNSYFFNHSPQRISGGKRAEFATMLATDLADYEASDSAETTIYFVGAPWMYWGFSTLPYLLPEVNGITFGEEMISAEQLRALDRTAGRVAFIITVERIHELDIVQSVFRHGSVIEYHAMSDGSSLGVLYIVANNNGEQ